MSKVIDLGSRFKSAFGYVSINESSNLKKQKFSKENGITGVNVYVNNSSFEEMTLRKNDTESLLFGSMLNIKGESRIYAPPPMISFSKSKKLIITEIDGTDAEVVERYGDKSWDVKIQGILIDMVNHQYPKQEVKKLNEFFEVQAALDVEGEMFDDLKIKSIYLTDIEIAGVAGYTDTIQYSISARSIKPIEFFFVKNNN
ncbi:DUF6046 domain-containing protein [Pedobacter sp. NJ-S-72]